MKSMTDLEKLVAQRKFKNAGGAGGGGGGRVLETENRP